MRPKIIDRKANGERIRFLMNKKSISTKEMATSLGVAYPTVNKYLSGQRLPEINILFNMANLLGVIIDDLLVVNEDVLCSLLRENA